MRTLYLIPIILLGLLAESYSQSLPSSSFNFMDLQYTLNEWSADAPAGTYPPYMIFHTSSKRDPVLTDTMDGDWNLAYNLTSDSRFLGLGEQGICFANTSNAATGGGYLGAVVMAIRIPYITEGSIILNRIKVSWLARTIDTASRHYGIALQYSLDSGKTYTDLDHPYIQQELPDDFEYMNSYFVTNNDGEKYVLLRWKYFYNDGETGKRSRLAIDDIELVSETDPIGAEDNNSVGTVAYYSSSAIALVLRDGQMPLDIALYSALGECVFSTTTQAGQQYVRLPELPAGAYFAALRNGGKSNTVSFVVVR